MRYYFFIFLWVFTNCFSLESSKADFVFLSPHKSGTNLFLKLFSLLNDDPRNSKKAIFRFRHSFPDNPGQYFPVGSKEKKMILLRDPRDILISHVYFWDRLIKVYVNNPTNSDIVFLKDYKETYEGYLELSLDEKIKSFLTRDFPRGSKAFQALGDRAMPPPFTFFYRDLQATNYHLEQENVSIFKFEDIVGPRGGGESDLQLNCITEIGKYMKVYIDPKKALDVASKLFGGTWTFRKGKSGEWKSHFSKENSRIFEALYGDLLIKWGYENDQSCLAKHCSLEVLPSKMTKVKEDLTEKIFSRIYEKKAWGVNDKGEGWSGPGSSLQQTQEYREFLKSFFLEYDIKSVVDFGCGDWTFSKVIDWSGIDYTGYDVVPSVIDKNKANYLSENVRFICGNGLHLDLPKGDLLLCKDVLQHLSNEEIKLFLKQIPKFKYVLVTNSVYGPLQRVNQQITTGSLRPVDLSKPPFLLEGKKIYSYFTVGRPKKEVFFIDNTRGKREQDDKKLYLLR